MTLHVEMLQAEGNCEAWKALISLCSKSIMQLVSNPILYKIIAHLPAVKLKILQKQLL